MNIEITQGQYDLIQSEIIRLEDEATDNRYKMNTWSFIAITDKIETLKQILRTGKIDLDKMN